MNKKILFFAAMISALFFILPGCAVDLVGYPPPGSVPEVYPEEAVFYPVGIYPYFWSGWYYYPYWNGTVWVYNRYPRPLAHWHGPALRHHGPPPRFWHKDGHPRHGPPTAAPGFRKPAPTPRAGTPGPGIRNAGPPRPQSGMAPRSPSAPPRVATPSRQAAPRQSVPVKKQHN